MRLLRGLFSSYKKRLKYFCFSKMSSNLKNYQFWCLIILASFFLVLAGSLICFKAFSVASGKIAPKLSFFEDLVKRDLPKTDDVSYQIGREKELSSALSAILAVKSATPSASSSAKIGIAVTDLSSGRTFGLNDDSMFELASVEKLLVASYAFSKIDRLEVSEDTLVSGKTLSEHLRLMINQSNNESWNALTSYFGVLNLQNYASEEGLRSFRVTGERNQATPQDMNLLLSKIYGNLLSPESKKKLLSFMNDTAFEQRIPQALPEGTLVYHKTGTLSNVVNDSGIIVGSRNPFILTIFTQNWVSQDDAIEIIRQVSKTVWDFYES